MLQSTAGRSFSLLVILFATSAATGCGAQFDEESIYEDDGEYEEEGHFHGEVDFEEPYYDELEDGYGTVASQLRRCTTRGVVQLSEQIAEEINCIAPGSLERFSSHPGIEITGSAVLPYMAPDALMRLRQVARRRTVQITSAYRSVAQQFMIHQWRAARRCRIPAAARPGRSPHESGRAIDSGNYSSIITTMRNHGFHRNVRGDAVHFEHTASPFLGELGILAFQRLWNRNNPNDIIDEDGDFGPATEARLRRSPAGGFNVGSTCEG